MITIEPLLPEHFPLAASWLAAPEINRWLTSEWRGRAVEPSVLAIASRNRRNRLCLVRSDGAPCGLVCLADIDPEDRCAMVWYLLGERQRGRSGIISEGVRLLCRIAFEELGLTCVYAWIMAENVASRRVLEHNGFREAGVLRRATRLGAEPMDRVYFDLVPGELRAGPRPA